MHESKKVKVKSRSRVRLFTTPWTTAYQAPPSMGFSRQEYWSGVPLPSLISFIHEYKDSKEEKQDPGSGDIYVFGEIKPRPETIFL